MNPYLLSRYRQSLRQAKEVPPKAGGFFHKPSAPEESHRLKSGSPLSPPESFQEERCTAQTALSHCSLGLFRWQSNLSF